MGHDAPRAERVHVHCRLRPPEDGSQPACDVSADGLAVTLNAPEQRPRSWTFDGVHGPNSTQAEVYDAVAVPVLESVMQGYNGTILAYGQTVSPRHVGLYSLSPRPSHQVVY